MVASVSLRRRAYGQFMAIICSKKQSEYGVELDLIYVTR